MGLGTVPASGFRLFLNPVLQMKAHCTALELKALAQTKPVVASMFATVS